MRLILLRGLLYYSQMINMSFITRLDTTALPWLPAAGRDSIGNPLQSAYEDLCTMRLICRIGSPSLNGEVYKCSSIFRLFTALKIMYLGNESSQEITVATAVSDAVKQQRATRFPIVYSTARCTETGLSDTPFSRVAIRQHRKQELVKLLRLQSNISNNRIRVIERSLGITDLDDIAAIVEPSDRKRMIMCGMTFTSQVMMSELAFCDINYLITHRSNILRRHKPIFAEIIIQCIDGILELFHLQIAHNDIHFGNFLIRTDSQNPTSNFFVMTHDFGRSEMNCSDLTNYIFDCEKLLDCILHVGVFQDEVHQGSLIINAMQTLKDVPEMMRQVQQLFRHHRNSTVVTLPWAEL